MHSHYTHVHRPTASRIAATGDQQLLIGGNDVTLDQGLRWGTVCHVFGDFAGDRLLRVVLYNWCKSQGESEKGGERMGLHFGLSKNEVI